MAWMATVYGLLKVSWNCMGILSWTCMWWQSECNNCLYTGYRTYGSVSTMYVSVSSFMWHMMEACNIKLVYSSSSLFLFWGECVIPHYSNLEIQCIPLWYAFASGWLPLDFIQGSESKHNTKLYAEICTWQLMSLRWTLANQPGFPLS